MSSKIRVDSNNIAHMMFLLIPTDEIIYVKYLGGISISSAVVTTGGSFDFDLDSSNNPHVVYWKNGLQYMKWTGVSWSTPTIIDYPQAFSTDAYSMAVDKNNNPHIVYGNRLNGPLNYAKWTGTSFTTQTIGNISTIYVSIDIDSNSYVHIAYRDNGLKYAKWTGTTWYISTVESSSSSGENNSIVIDSSGYPHISYDDSANLLRYTKWNGSLWVKEVISSINHNGGKSCIALDSQNKPSISFNNGRCNCARWDGSTWNVASLGSYPGDSGGVVTSIAIDSNNNPYCAYGGYSLLEFAKIVDAPTLSWTGEEKYSSDGVDPNIGSGGGQYIFRVKYTNADDNPPGIGYPKVVIKKGQSSNQTIVLNYESGSYLTGAIYSTTTAINTVGDNMSYYFETYDIWHASAPILSAQGPMIGKQPVLSWTGEQNYTSSGVFPTGGSCYTQFTFKIKYCDGDGDPPKNDSPLLAIWKPNGMFYKSMVLNYESGDYLTGAVYSTTTVISVVGNDFKYEISSFDIWNSSAVAFFSGNGPIVQSSYPIISYQSDSVLYKNGLSAQSGYESTLFKYQIMYFDEHVPKEGYPKLHILENGLEITGSPFILNETDYADKKYDDGKLYEYVIRLVKGVDYSYFFEAYDKYDLKAVGEPCNIQNGPVVSGLDIPFAGEARVVGSTANHGIINPDKGETAQIYFQGSSLGTYKCKILSNKGELLYETEKNNVNSGYFEWVPRNIASGIYIAKIEGPGLNVKKKIAILR
ncbi:MAG: hypothetical protein A3J83_02555 [Elusimicrobia bacterium RIFOXYA2_FULL_40_6]|nr:MAG: hypothetical protein A3J83_02555 [Elusimicrobia bacterium RIFOXYA2_FULL_40_6]